MQMKDAAAKMTEAIRTVSVIGIAAAQASHDLNDPMKLHEAAAPILQLVRETAKGPRQAIAILATVLSFVWETQGGAEIAAIGRGEAEAPIPDPHKPWLN